MADGADTMQGRLSRLMMAAMLLSLVLLQGRWLTPNVYTLPLGRCDVDWHAERGVVAVACAGRDMIRVWPLPVERPWSDDDEAAPGRLALRSA